ncbi:DNA-binding protein [bacterium]|nr:MAG: DNA-binding protein [bacterium]
MTEEKLLTVRDVASILGISEKEVLDLSENGSIPAYKVGGVYLRFRRDQIEAFKKSFKVAESSRPKINGGYSFRERVSDFFYFNDFYILSVLLILLILVIIFRGY